mmetsp:Transcript_53493/g.64515  ORF Transcript_53493/g.64515 Transcript_53493/m.64515 type:complete len:301 (-) Transcript_53493:150-1052(-)
MSTAHNIDRASYDNIEQSLITPPDRVLPIADATPTVEVTAPADLPEGYEFDAQVGNRVFSIKVPRGGVERGQKFTVTLPGGSDSLTDTMCHPRTSIPTGAWRDGLCDCFKHGIIHPIIFNGFLCPLIAAGQVMTRLGLNYVGQPGRVSETTQTFRKILFLVIAFVSIDSILLAILIRITFAITTGINYATSNVNVVDVEKFAGTNDLIETYNTIASIRGFLRLIFFVFTLYVITKTRKFLRNKYAIQEKVCKNGAEDFCCALCCSCCVVTQMARHTADYNTYRGVCCTDTGLPEHVPGIV